MALIITIKVIPASSRRRCVIDASGGIKCYVTSQPEKGKANKELVELLADILKIPKYRMAVVSGMTTRLKKVAVETTKTLAEILSSLEQE